MPTTPCDAAPAGDCFALPPRISVAPQSAATRELRASPCSSSDAASPRSDADAKHGAQRRGARAGSGGARTRSVGELLAATRRQRADAPPPLAAGLSKRAAPRMWTEEEHALFLHGLELGYRGRWAKLASEILHGGRTPAQARALPRATSAHRAAAPSAPALWLKCGAARLAARASCSAVVDPAPKCCSRATA